MDFYNYSSTMRLEITGIAFRKSIREKAVICRRIRCKTNLSICVSPEFNRTPQQGENSSHYFCHSYLSAPWEKDGFQRMKIVGNNTGRVRLFRNFGERLAGATVVLSFGLRNPYHPPFVKNGKPVPSVFFIDLESSEVSHPCIKSVVWSSQEHIKFGVSSPQRSTINRNETGFLHIETRAMYGKKVRVDICKNIDAGNGKIKQVTLKTFSDVQIKDNVAYIPVSMDEIYRTAGGNNVTNSLGIVAQVSATDVKPMVSNSIKLLIEKKVRGTVQATVQGVKKFKIKKEEKKKEEKDKSTIDFHIYYEGARIEKHIPANYNEHSNPILKYNYYYHINEHEYFIITLDAIITQGYVKGVKSKPKKGVEYTLIDVPKSRGGVGPIYYLKTKGKVILVKLPEGINVTVGSKLIKYIDNSARNYCLPQAAASLFAALAECSYNFIVFNGCTNPRDMGYPSISHAGGTNMDFRYIRKDRATGASFNISVNSNYKLMDIETQNKFIAALKKHGWTDPRGYNPNKNPDFHVKHLPNHGSHLHCQGYSKYIAIKIK